MKTSLINVLIAVILLIIPTFIFAQAPTLGTVSNFVLFSSNGAVSNTGVSQLTGNVGTNNGSSTGFGNVNGVMHDNDGASAQCMADLLTAYGQLNTAIPTYFIAPLLGNGDTLIAGVYFIAAATTLNLDLTLNAQGNPNAMFIFQIQGPLSTNASSKIKLINGAMACNVFWKVEGLVSMASGTSMKGTIVANNAAIIMNTGDTLEGRVLSTAGAITIDGVLAYTPIGCGSPVLTGPVAPTLGAAACYAIYSTNGAVYNSGITYITGDVGSNNGSATGFNHLFVTGAIHPIPDGSTAQCAIDLLSAYNYIDTLPYDIELLYPAQFGNSLVLTPHTYRMNGAATFTDTVFLNAEGNANAVFVIQINGAITTSTYSNVVLMNGAQSKNVYWKIEGAVSINNYSIFRGTIICNNGALGAFNTGVTLDGRSLTTTGAVTTTAINAIAPNIPSDCGTVGITTLNVVKINKAVVIYPNPFNTYIDITVNDASINNNFYLTIYNIIGNVVINKTINKRLSTIETNNLPKGIYFYKLVGDDKSIHSGKLISK
ncbi:MAG: ice-binding family protein [Bacteroidota bacterium]